MASMICCARSSSRSRSHGGASLRVWPCTVKQATAWVKALHRHLPDLEGGLFCAAIGEAPDEASWRGVAVVGHPAQVWQGTGRCVISRVATDGVPQGCSMLYGALCRAAKALGYVEAWTYTLPEEPGTSLRAAGFEDMGMGKGGEWDRDGRPRGPAADDRPKRRWRRVLVPDTPPWHSTAKREKDERPDPQGLLWEGAA